MVKVLYLTPPDVPEDEECRTLKIPSSKDWLGVFNSALLTMLNPYNWEQVNDTDLTVDDAIAYVQNMIMEFWDTPGCLMCLQPTGSRIMRLGALGQLEQLNNDTWEEPTGDYAVPPVPPRDEITAYERRCAAAANAANVLMLLYEEVSDLVAAHATSAEIIAAMVALAAIQVGAWLGLALAALVGLAYALFLAFIEIAEFIAADLWTTEFNDVFKCILLQCATDDGSVVTFDFECVREGMAASVEILDPEVINNIRLFGQIDFMLNVIGVDGLNAAGATTAITDADCSDCDGWTVCWLNGDGLGDWVTPTVVPDDVRSAGVYNSGGDSIDSTAINIFGDEWANFELSEALTITGINIDYDYVNDVSSGSITFWADGVLADTVTPLPAGSGSTSWAFVPMSASPVTLLQLRFAALGSIKVRKIKIDGTGTHPASGADCV